MRRSSSLTRSSGSKEGRRSSRPEPAVEGAIGAIGCRRTTAPHARVEDFLGPPDDAGSVEIGYGLVPEARGRGLGTDLVRPLVALASADPRVRQVRANIDPGNRASRRMLENASVRLLEGDDQRRYPLEVAPAHGLA